jgi:DNA-binding transcriptional ArsR family regulator
MYYRIQVFYKEFFMTQLDDQALIHIAKYFQALAEPMRLKILNGLREGEKNVTELVEISGGTQANVSKHLNLLRESKLIKRESRGTKAYYTIADQRTYDLCNLVCGQIASQMSLEAAANEAFISILKTNQ